MNEQKQHILLVEDEHAHVEIMRRAFEATEHNFRLSVAQSLHEARLQLAWSAVDLIIADLRLPDGQGTEFLDHDGQAAPLVILTAQGDEDIAVAAIKSGALDYQVKSPGTLAALPYIAERAIREWKHITARKQAEEALRASEARYRAVIEGSLQGISIIQEEKFIYANKALAIIYGYPSPEDIIGQSFLHHVAPHERSRLTRSYDARQQGDAAPVREEYQAVTRDGAPLWIEQITTPILWEGGAAFLLTILDITERKQAEETQQSLEAQLWQAKKMEAIGNLAGGIAHDFNNTLAAIMAFTELAAMKTAPTDEIRESLEGILVASERAKVLVQQILTFSRTSGEERSPISLEPLVEEVLKLLRAALPSTIDIQQFMVEDAGAVLANATQLHQVLMNLCINAEYAMRETGGVLQVRVEPFDVSPDFADQHCSLHPGPHLRISVRDTGRGMKPETMERVFEPFFTTKGVGEGTGLGLAIVHGLVTSHHGVITVSSQIGEGTTFEIYFPQVDLRPEAASGFDLSGPEGEGHILLVDDEAVLVRAIKTILEIKGYSVVATTSGAEALELFRSSSEPFDAVITDQTMPGLTGEQLAMELRQLQPDIPVILCTGFSHIMGPSKAQALHLDAFLMKPTSADDLLRTVKQVLSASC